MQYAKNITRAQVIIFQSTFCLAAFSSILVYVAEASYLWKDSCSEIGAYTSEHSDPVVCRMKTSLFSNLEDTMPDSSFETSGDDGVVILKAPRMNRTLKKAELQLLPDLYVDY